VAGDRARYDRALSKGHSLSWDQRWRDAIEQFKLAAAEFAEEPAPYAGLGVAYVELGELKEGLESYKLAARLSRGEVIYLRQVAEVQERLGQYDSAGQTYMAMGEIQLRRGALDDAAQNWNRAIHLAPNLLGAHQRLAHYYTQQNQTRAAIREHMAIARLLQARGDQERALRVSREALNLDPRNPEVLTAIEMIQHGESIFGPGDVRAVTPGGDTQDLLKGAIAAQETPSIGEASPAQNAQRVALEQLAEELFEEESARGESGLSKTERDALLSKALDFQTRGLTNEAINYYERAVEGGVRSPAVHFNLGLLYQDKLRFEDAIRELQVAVQDRNYRLGSHFALGENYRARGQIDKAVEHFITVLKIVDLATVQHDQADRLIKLYENLADSLVTRGETEKATAFANALVDFLGHKGWEDKVKAARARLNALSGDRMMILGDILTAGSAQVLESLYLSQEHARRNMLDTAIEEVYRAISLSPEYLPAHIQLGELLVRQDRIDAAVAKLAAVGDTFRIRGDVGSAINMYERIVQISPLDLPIRARLVDLLKQQGQIDASLEHYLAMGEAYYQLAQVDKARETYQEAMKLAPRGSEEHNWRARVLHRQADIDLQRFDWPRALAAYRELRQEEPNDERTAITLIDLYYRVGQSALALRELDQYLKQLVAAGRGNKVAGILEDMARRHPAEAPLVYRLVRLYLSQNRRQEAFERLDALGEALLEAGETQKAITTIEQIVRLNPPNILSYQQLLKQLQES
jgi:tetratricopeptide (TPR) repeat protein